MKRERIKIVITAGPTREPIDPVRFISNYSTGVLGYTIAREAKNRGHKVVLISGPTCLMHPVGVRMVEIETAFQMQQVLWSEFKTADCLIMNAAVCDYRPFKFSTKKLKKGKKDLNIKLVENPDILRSIASRKGKKLVIGFSLETEYVERNAVLKLNKKRLDLIVASKIDSGHMPFGYSKISPYIIDKYGRCEKMSNITKQELARKLLDRIETLWYTTSTNRRRGRNSLTEFVTARYNMIKSNT